MEKVQNLKLKQKNPQISVEQIENFVKNMHEKNKIIREFHDYLNGSNIMKCWECFRDSETQKDGQICYKDYLQVMNKVFPQKFRELYELIFNRFSPDFNQKVNFHELLITLTVFIKRDQKTRMSVLLKLMDGDEDNCLSILEIKNLINTLEEKFIMFTSNFQSNNRSDLCKLAGSFARYKFNYLLNYKYESDTEDKLISQILVSYQEFFQLLEQKPKFSEEFLPNCLVLFDFLKFQFKNDDFLINNRNFGAFANFQEQLHLKINNGNFAENRGVLKERGGYETGDNMSVFGENNMFMVSQKTLKGKFEKRIEGQLPVIKKTLTKQNVFWKNFKEEAPVKSTEVKFATFEEKQKLIKILKIPILIPNHMPISKIFNSF